MKQQDFDDAASSVGLVAKIRAYIPDRSLPPGILDLVVDTLRATGKTDEALKLVELSLLKHMDESPLRSTTEYCCTTVPAATASSKAKLAASWYESSCSAARQ